MLGWGEQESGQKSDDSILLAPRRSIFTEQTFPARPIFSSFPSFQLCPEYELIRLSMCNGFEFTALAKHLSFGLVLNLSFSRKHDSKAENRNSLLGSRPSPSQAQAWRASGEASVLPLPILCNQMCLQTQQLRRSSNRHVFTQHPHEKLQVFLKLNSRRCIFPKVVRRVQSF